MSQKAMIGKSYSSVLDMLREEFPDNPEYAEAAKESYGRQKIGNLLW